MMKEQRISAWQLPAHGTWEGISTFYCRACGAFLHSSIQRLFSVECTGNPHRAMERLASAVERVISCTGKAHLVHWKVDFHREPPVLPQAEIITLIAIATPNTSETRHRFDILSPFIPLERRQVYSRLTQPEDRLVWAGWLSELLHAFS